MLAWGNNNPSLNFGSIWTTSTNFSPWQLLCTMLALAFTEYHHFCVFPQIWDKAEISIHVGSFLQRLECMYIRSPKRIRIYRPAFHIHLRWLHCFIYLSISACPQHFIWYTWTIINSTRTLPYFLSSLSSWIPDHLVLFSMAARSGYFSVKLVAVATSHTQQEALAVSSLSRHKPSLWSCCSRLLQSHPGFAGTTVGRPIPEIMEQGNPFHHSLSIYMYMLNKQQQVFCCCSLLSCSTYWPSASLWELSHPSLCLLKKHPGPLDLLLHEISPSVCHNTIEDILIREPCLCQFILW